MKPVNLLPGNAPVVSVEGAKPNVALLGGAAAGLLAVVVVAGYFGMARVDSVKSETAAANDAAAAATSETAAVRSTIASLGQPVIDSDKQLAEGAEQVLVAAYTERHDFVQLARELRGIMQGTGGWYVTVTASSAGAAGDTGAKAVSITGYMPTEQLAASFNERINATRTLTNAEHVSLESEVLAVEKTRRPGTYWKFTITADMVDTVAPTSDESSGGSTADATGALVANGGGDSGELTLSLDSEPKVVVVHKPKVVVPAKPKNPFDVAAAAASAGGAS